MTEEVHGICRDALTNLYRTLAGVKDWQIVTVDNGSKYPVTSFGANFKYIRNERNKGIAAAWNQGIEASQGEYIVFLNSDCFPHGEWLSILLGEMEQRMDEGQPIGALSPTMCEPEQREAIQERVGEFCDGACGACFMIKRLTFNEVGLFDERFAPCYYEDEDMWTRMKAKGYVLMNTTKCSMVHLFSKSAEQSDELDKIKAKNKKLYEEKHG